MHDLHDLLPQPKHIVGCGLGGVVALEYAILYPEYTQSVTCIGSGLTGHKWPKSAYMNITEYRRAGRYLNAGASLGGYQKDIVEGKQRFIASNGTWAAIHTGSETAKQLIKMAKAYRGFHFFSDDPQTPDPFDGDPLRIRLPQVQVPVCVMIGEEDTEDFRDIAQEIADGVTASVEVKQVEGGHFAVLESPEKVAEQLLSFWEGVR